MLDVGEGVGEDLRFLEGACPGPRGLLVHVVGRSSLFQRDEFGVHICTISFLDDVVSGALGCIAALVVLARG